MNTCHHAVHVRLLKRTLEKISEIKAVRDGGMWLLIVATECSLSCFYSAVLLSSLTFTVVSFLYNYLWCLVHLEDQEYIWL